MKTKLAFTLLLLALLAPIAALADDDHEGHEGQSARTLVLIAQINNGTDARTVLLVYSDGEAVLARKDADEPDGEICTTSVPADRLAALSSALWDAGAFHLRDADVVPNVTRKTISFFIADDHGGRSVGNTFRYSTAVGPYLAVAQAVGTLLSQNFGDCI
jgi:hypothetical protein